MSALHRAVALAAGFLSAGAADAQQVAPPQTVTIVPGAHEYLAAGEFIRDGKAVAPRKTTMTFDQPLEIMKYQVSASDYGACVAEGICNAPHGGGNGPGKPVTGVSFTDAIAFAQWLSRKTGQEWRLPTDAEWSFAAGERFGGEAVQAVADANAPAAAWVANYERMARNAAEKDPVVHPLGKFGENGLGVADLAGNVWEWTSSCYVRASLDAEGGVLAEAENCGVRVIEGRHRSYMTYFIQDAASGGCAVGMTPDHLGFRLVREQTGFYRTITKALSRLMD